MLVLFFIVLIFALAIIFTWTNGVQHGSAVAASSVASHAMTRRKLILVIFIAELTGTLLGGSAVAAVIQSLSKWPKEPTLLPLLASALLASIIWNFLARHIHVPASSTHSLIGATVGALIAGSGNCEKIALGKFDLIHPSGVTGAVVSLFLSPLLGFAFGYVLFCLLTLAFLHLSKKAALKLRGGKWLMTAALAFGDGQNDTQKTMGLLVLALNAAGYMTGEQIPLWMRAMIGLAMGLGAFGLSDGLIKELAFGVYKLRTIHAIASDVSSAGVLISNSLIGGPVSASQVISASLMGAGAAEHGKGIHWLVIKEIALSWLVTLPGAALLAAILQLSLFQWGMQALTG